MRIIELFGLPGAGKTTCANKIIKEAQSADINVMGLEDFDALSSSVTKIKKIQLVAKHFPEYIRYICPIIKISSGNIFAGIEFWRRVVKSPLYYILIDDFFANKSSSVYLADQGSVQYLWSIMVRSNSFSCDTVKSISALWAQRQDTKYVYLKVDPAMAAKRVFERDHGDSMFDGKDYDKVQKDFLIFTRYFESIIENMTKNGISVHTINTQVDILDSVSYIRDLFQD